jgi:large subunit ribosomal protein L22
MQDIQAHLRFLPMSAQKVRLVVDLVRGKDANSALEMLRFVPKAAALPVRKLLASAVANAEENFGVSRDDLYVAKILLMKLPPANGAALVHAVVSSRYFAAIPM